MKPRHVLTLLALGAVVAVAASEIVRNASTQLGGDLVRLQVLPDGTQVASIDERYVTFDYDNGTPRRLVVTQLADAIFADAFEVTP